MEFAGDNYYLTQTTGTTRKKIAAYDDTSGATGDIYYRNSSGYFTRLGVGSTGNVLTVAGGIPSWSSSISNTSTITLKDTNFTLQDDGNTTKQLKFELSGISASTTRTLTVPDANTTIVGTDVTQTLTNKTITSPTIDGTPISTFADTSGGSTVGRKYLLDIPIVPDQTSAGVSGGATIVGLQNDLAYLTARGGAITVTQNSVDISSSVLPENWFIPGNYVNLPVDATSDVYVITITRPTSNIYSNYWGGAR